MIPITDEDTDEFSSVAAINSSKSDTMTPEELSRRLCIGLKTAARTLKATSHQYIRTTGLLSKRFRTDKAQLRYKRYHIDARAVYNVIEPCQCETA